MLRLEIRQRDQVPFSFESAQIPLFVGRDQSMDLVLSDPLVSRQHAVIVSRGASFVIQDMGGRNPVRVNDKVVVSHVLHPGDVIGMGSTELVFLGQELRVAEADPDALSESSEAAELRPTVVDARESLQGFRDPGQLLSGEDTVSGFELAWDSDDARARRILRTLQNFSEVIRNFADRQKLVEATLNTVFDILEVKRGFLGFFNSNGQLDICVERDGAPGTRARRPIGLPYSSERSPAGDRCASGVSYGRSIVDRVRKEAVAILFSVESDAEDATSAILERSGNGVQPLRIKNAMCLPLFRSDQVCGVLYVDNRERLESFTQEDLYFASILSDLISLALEKEDLYEEISAENIELKTILQQKNRLIGVSPAATEIQRKIKRVAGFDTTVLITGESGTGKELVARAIHDRSPRRGRPFVAVNCAAIPEPLLESELFGYAPRSGISGADPKGKPGKFELAHGGTLFLDEIGDMSLSTQAKILRVLEDRVVERLGGMQGRRVDLRILAATNKVLSELVTVGQFREDLYYRLKVFQIHQTPLRERRDDILPLAQHFLAMHQQERRAPIELSPRAKEVLLAYHWPGNVRELKHCIEEAILLSNGRTIYPENLPPDLRRDDNPEPFGTLAEVEAQHIRRVLQSVNWNKRRASEMLGINRSTLYEKIRLYGIERPEEAKNPGTRRPTDPAMLN